jgi:hypothetical protein
VSDPAWSGEDADRVVDALSSAIAEVITREEHGMVTKWALVVETVGPDGQRGVWVSADRQAKSWDTVGLLQWALMHEQAEEVVTAWGERFGGDG